MLFYSYTLITGVAAPSFKNGYLYNSSISCTGSCSVVDLTPKAHEFINNIRKDTNWNKTKEVAGKVGSFSLNVLSQIATNVITSLINSYTGLT